MLKEKYRIIQKEFCNGEFKGQSLYYAQRKPWWSPIWIAVDFYGYKHVSCQEFALGALNLYKYKKLKSVKPEYSVSTVYVEE